MEFYEINDENKELLIDYLLETEVGKSLDNKYAALEGIILSLVKKSEVSFIKTEHGLIEEFLESFDFVKRQFDIPIVDGVVVKYTLNIDSLVTDVNFNTYRYKSIKESQKEISDHEKDIEDLKQKIEKIKKYMIGNEN